MKKILMLSLITAAVAQAEIPQPRYPINLESIEYSTFIDSTGSQELPRFHLFELDSFTISGTNELRYKFTVGLGSTTTCTFSADREWLGDSRRYGSSATSSSAKVSYDKTTRTKHYESSYRSGYGKSTTSSSRSADTVYNEKNMPVYSYTASSYRQYMSKSNDTVETYFNYEYNEDGKLEQTLLNHTNGRGFHNYSYSEVDGYECITITKTVENDSTGLIEEKFSPVIKYCTASDTIVEVYNSESELMVSRTEKRYNDLGQLVELILYRPDDINIITSKRVISYTEEGDTNTLAEHSYNEGSGEREFYRSYKYNYKKGDGATPILSENTLNTSLTPQLSVMNKVLNISLPGFSGNNSTKVSVVDYRGRILINQSAYSSDLQLNLESLAFGPYIVRIETEGLKSVTRNILIK